MLLGNLNVQRSKNTNMFAIEWLLSHRLSPWSDAKLNLYNWLLPILCLLFALPSDMDFTEKLSLYCYFEVQKLSISIIPFHYYKLGSDFVKGFPLLLFSTQWSYLYRSLLLYHKHIVNSIEQGDTAPFMEELSI